MRRWPAKAPDLEVDALGQPIGLQLLLVLVLRRRKRCEAQQAHTTHAMRKLRACRSCAHDVRVPSRCVPVSAPGGVRGAPGQISVALVRSARSSLSAPERRESDVQAPPERRASVARAASEPRVAHGQQKHGWHLPGTLLPTAAEKHSGRSPRSTAGDASRKGAAWTGPADRRGPRTRWRSCVCIRF